MCSRTFVRSGLLLAVMLLTPEILAAQATEEPVLAGTGIEPNVVSYVEYNDPLIRFNRAMFAFNDVSYRYVLIPAAHSYQQTPAFVRTGVANFFNNIKTPIPLVNHLLQLQPDKAGIDFLRFVINSTLGVAGVFDPATAWFNLEREDTGMSETLIGYRMQYGAYLVLPLVGPTNLRDGGALLADAYLNPLAYILENPESILVRGFDNFQEFAPNADGYLQLREESDDLYIFMRNLHLQGMQRDAEFK
jgi:phospholipid-binding lipoprotein MlaA